MPRPRRDPYVPMDATIRRNAKMACLPSDSARLGWLYVGLGDAKLQRPSGCFRSRSHWDEVAGRFSRFLRDYLAVGLLEVAPDLCDRCRPAWTGIAEGTLVVHDWKRHNTDPGAAERAETWRNSGGSNGDGTPNVRPSNDHRTANERNANADLARDPAGPRGGKRKGNQKENVPSRSKDASSAADEQGPLLTRAQLDAWSSFGPEWGALRAAWLDRGLRLPPSGGADEDGSQRAVLYPIVDAFPSRVAAWVRGAPAGASGREVVGHVIAQYREATAAAGDEVPEWMGGPTRAEAAEALGEIMARVLP